ERVSPTTVLVGELVMIVGGVTLNLITLTLIFLVDFCHLVVISVRVSVRLSVGFGPSFGLLAIEPPHGFVIFLIELAEPVSIAVSVIAVLVIVRGIGIIRTLGRSIIPTPAKLIRVVIGGVRVRVVRSATAVPPSVRSTTVRSTTVRSITVRNITVRSTTVEAAVRGA